MFDGTYPHPADAPKKADFTDCTQRRPKEAKESTIIETKAAYPAWNEGTKLYIQDMIRFPQHYDLRPIYKGLHGEDVSQAVPSELK